MPTNTTTDARTYSRYEIPGLVDRPDWWRVRVDEVHAAVAGATRGIATQIATSPLGHAVHAVAYGPPAPEPGTATWASASASGDVTPFKTRDEPQSIVLLCGMHGAEPESVAGAVNLISLLETGKDLRGQVRPALVELCQPYRLVIVPCLNPDGRSVSPDHLRGASMDDFRRASQGYWNDGSQIGYPVCKKYHPLPLDKVAHPGGYPNAAGYNIQHDSSPGDVRTDEARGLYRLFRDEQTDLLINMHSHAMPPRALPPSLTCYPLHAVRTASYMQRIHDDLAAADLNPAPVMNPTGRSAIGVNTAIAQISGGLAVTFEHPTTDEFTFEQILEIFYVTVECFLRHGRDEPFAPREAVMRGREE
ncbi:MAG: M14 family zinc carboxypeptidase [Phycisphaeraceae bacterium]